MHTHVEPGFRQAIRQDLTRFVAAQQGRFPAHEALRVDLHCHDHHSSVPDELLGRILHWPETWVTTDEVRASLKANGATALTITNHNNARSCFELLERGIDVLVGAEFTCVLPGPDVHVHVLTYGFSPAQEERLLSARGDLLRFLDLTRELDLITVLAHPLYFYATRKVPTLDVLERLTLLFDRFEVLNGQRDTWQNLLMVSWLQELDEERVEAMSRRTGIDSRRFCQRPVHKVMTGGSDDHMAMFVGLTGSLCHVPGLAERRKKSPESALVLEALREGRVVPYGSYTVEEKLAASFLDYFCQIVRQAEDPGLIRMFLHQGSTRQKLWAFLIANGISELRRHRYTSRFIDAAHEALHGRKPGFLQKYGFSKEYRPLVRELEAIAEVRRRRPAELEEQMARSIPSIFHELATILAGRVQAKVERHRKLHEADPPVALQHLIERLELPADLRRLFGGTEAAAGARRMSDVDLRSMAEGLPFPGMAALVIGGSAFTSARVLFANRQLLDEVSAATGRYRHPRRVLWLTDTFADKNGVAGVLRLLHAEAVRLDLPIDFCVCHGEVEPDGHLKVLRPLLEVEVPYYEQQPLRIFDLLELQRLFVEGGYDRIVCSTEGLMGLAALYLKGAFSVPAYFYVHTDWMDFARRTLGLDGPNTDRVRRLLRAFYQAYDGLFVLNSEQREWFSSEAMGIPPERIRQTAHWADARFGPRVSTRAACYPGVDETAPVMLFVGRVSDEKGVMELPGLLEAVRREVPNARLVVVGTGPAEERLRRAAPDAVFIPWVETDRLADLYCAADCLVLPSRFDTFGCVVLEALASGLPVVAYRTKGPRDIIEHGTCGFTVETQAKFAGAVIEILRSPSLRDEMRAASVKRAEAYRPGRIVDELMCFLGLGGLPGVGCEGPLPRVALSDGDLGAWHVEDARN